MLEIYSWDVKAVLKMDWFLGDAAELFPFPLPWGVVFQVLGLHACGLLRRATVIHGNVGYALKVMAKLEPSGLRGVI